MTESHLTWSELKALDLSGIRDAADGWREAGSRADAARERVAQEMIGTLRGTEEGEAQKAAVRRLERLRENLHYIYVECGLARTALDGLAAELRPHQRKVAEAVDEATAREFTVHEDGSVTYPAAGEEKDGATPEGGTVTPTPLFLEPIVDSIAAADPNPHRAAAQDIADVIAFALRHAREVDSEYAATIGRLKTEPGISVTGDMWTDAHKDAVSAQEAAEGYLDTSDIPMDASPAERECWWKGLSEEEQQRLLTLYPHEIGSLDGIPAEVRDDANRTYLPLLMGKLEGEGGEEAGTKLQGLRVIEGKLREGSVPPMFLLGVGDEGNGRAIVSYGNPDTAKNVSAYVPGLGTALDEGFASGDLKRAQDTALAAQKYDPSSASLVWLGYDAPQLDMGDFPKSLEVLTKGPATEGGSAYSEFMAGLSVTNEHPDPHVTAVGHSYGSLTVGMAAQQPGGIPGVDDIVLVGSPGVDADSASELGVGKGHVFVGASDNDLVTKSPSPGELKGAALGGLVAGPLGGILGYELGDIGDDDIYFGKDPASEAFGATRFKVDDGPAPVVGGEGLAPAHSNYFSPENDPESLANIAAVVADRPDLVTREERR